MKFLKKHWLLLGVVALFFYGAYLSAQTYSKTIAKGAALLTTGLAVAGFFTGLPLAALIALPGWMLYVAFGTDVANGVGNGMGLVAGAAGGQGAAGDPGLTTGSNTATNADGN